MCANGPASRSGSAVGRAASSTSACSAASSTAQHRHHVHLGVVGRDQVRRRRRPSRSRSAATAASRRRWRRDASGRRAAAGRRPGAAGRRPSRPGGPRAAARAPRRGRATERTGAGTPAPTTGPRRGRSASSSGHARLKASAQLVVLGAAPGASWSGGTSVVVDACRRRIVSSSSQTWSRASLCGVPGSGDVERLGPVVGAEPQVGPRRLDLHPLGGRLLVEPDGRLDRRHHVGGRLQAGDLRVALDRGRGSLGTRSRRVQVCTPSSPRLGRTSAT